MGSATANGEYADVCSSVWISRLRAALRPELRQFGVKDLDASVLQQTAPRALTQQVSRIVFQSGYAGIYYRSKYGHDIENWAVFEPFPISFQGSQSIQIGDPDLQQAFKLHSLKIKG